MSSQYRYEALDADGVRRQGVLAAETEEQVLDFLSQHRLMPISINLKRRPLIQSWYLFRKTDYEGLILFTNGLLTMYRAGIPLLRALSILRVGPEGSRFNQAIEQIRIEVHAGKPLSAALDGIRDLFPRVYVSCIAAGEESGKLDGILEELAAMLESEMDLIRQIKAGIRYPVLVISAIVVAVCVLMVYVVPRFVSFYASFGAELPWATKFVIGVSNFMTGNWYFMLGGLVAILFGFRAVRTSESGRLWLDRQALRLPVIGDLIIKGSVARFMLLFRILFKSGLPIVKSLEVLRGSIKNSAIGRETSHLAGLFREGRDSMLTSAGLVYFPELALHMMAIGLESGSLERMLSQIGIHYTREVQYTSRRLTAILEPILTLVLGVFVLILALAVLLPMWNLINVFRGS